MENKYQRNNRIKEALDLRGMKQVELCEKTGLGKSSINNWISQRWQPKQHALLLMARALDVSEMWLAGYDVPKERPVEQVKMDQIARLTHRLKNDNRLSDLVISICKLSDSQFTTVETMVSELLKINSQQL